MSDKLKIKNDAQVDGDLTVEQDLEVKVDAVIRGNLTIEGTETVVDTTNLDVSDSEITINAGGSDATAEEAGILVERDGTDGKIAYDSSSPTKFKVGDLGSEDNVVGETSTQTLTNKTIDADNNTISNLAHGAEVDNPSSGVHGVTGDVVGTTDSQTLSNKTIDADNNTISNLSHGSEVDNPSSNVHGVTGNVVGTTDVQTLSNKTLSSPDINSPDLDGGTINDADIDGGTASNTSRITIPKNTKANLDALTRKEGTIVYATDEAKFFIDNGTNLVEVSGSGAGGLNYVINPDGEANADEWNAYADAAQENPEDGTGGSPTVTITRTTSTPLRGTGSLLLTKDAANRQGEGVSTDITIDRADSYSTIKVSLDYEISSGTYADDDLGVYLIETSGPTVKKVGDIKNVVNQGKFTGSAQVDGNSTWRLAIHVQSTSASAYTLEFDNVKATNDAITVVTNSDDWRSYTPSSTTSNYTISEAFYRRVGDSISFKIALDVSNSSASTTFDPSELLPPNLTIDEDKLPDNGTTNDQLPVGLLHYNDVGTAAHVYGLEYRKDTSKFVPRAEASASYPTEASGDAVVITVSDLPISGWGSNFAFSEDGPNVAVDAFLTSDQTHTSSGAWQTITGYTVNNDSHAAFNSTTGVFTAPVSGFYSINAQAVVSTVTTGRVGLAVILNGSTFKATQLLLATTQADYRQVSKQIHLDAGDTIELDVFQEESASETIASGETATYLTISRLGTEINVGSQQARFQTKTLSSDVTSDGAISDLTFNNLQIGKAYEFKLQADIRANVSSADNSIQIEVTHDGNVIGRASNLDANGSQQITQFTTTGIFVATATSLTFVAVSASANSTINGNGSRTETYAQLIEKPGMIETADFT